MKDYPRWPGSSGLVATVMLLCGTVLSSEEDAAPTPKLEPVDIRKVVRVEEIPLAPPWAGVLTQILPESTTPKTRQVNFTHYCRDASKYSDPDCPRPPLIAIFAAEVSPKETLITGEMALFTPMHEDWARTWKTFGDVLSSIQPIRVFDEEARGVEAEYWLNTFDTGDGDNEMDVYFVTFTGPRDPERKNFLIKNLQVWQGTLKPVVGR